jgi:hypothetical protein
VLDFFLLVVEDLDLVTLDDLTCLRPAFDVVGRGSDAGAVVVERVKQRAGVDVESPFRRNIVMKVNGRHQSPELLLVK